MEKEIRKLSFYSLKPHLFNLRVLGYYQIDPKSPKLQRFLHEMYIRVTLLLFIIYTSTQALHAVQVRHDIDNVIGTMVLFLTHTDCIYKQIVLWLRADQIEDLLDTMRGPLFNQGEAEHRECLLRAARHGNLLLRMDNILAAATCLLWTVDPLILHAQGKYAEFPMWLPFDVNTNPVFYLTVIYFGIMTTWLGMANTTMDVMVAVLLTQCQTQLYILRNNLTKLVQKSEAIYMCKKKHCSSVSYENIFCKQFETNIKHHVEILKFAKKMQDIFGGAIAYQFLVSGWIICTSVYKMVQMNPLSLHFFTMVLYILCMLVELFLYCYYGSQVTHEVSKEHTTPTGGRRCTYICTQLPIGFQGLKTSEMLTNSAYAMNWVTIPVKCRRCLIIFMERIKFSIQPLAGYIIPLSNNTFVSIVKSSYTLYAVLKNSNE